MWISDKQGIWYLTPVDAMTNRLRTIALKVWWQWLSCCSTCSGNILTSGKSAFWSFLDFCAFDLSGGQEKALAALRIQCRCQASSLRALSAAWQVFSSFQRDLAGGSLLQRESTRIHLTAFPALVLLSSGSFLHDCSLTFPIPTMGDKLLHLSKGIRESMNISSLSQK